MINLLIGQPGSGKTKEMISNANEEISKAKGNMVFIGESDESILEINHAIRYINISEFPIDSSNTFNAFLYGLVGSDNDIEKIYLDGILNIYIMTPNEISNWLEKIKVLSTRHNVAFDISLSLAGDVPESLKPYIQ